MNSPTDMLSVKIRVEVLDRLRDVVYWKSGTTLNSYVENAILEALTKEDDIKKRPNDLRRGRPIR